MTKNPVVQMVESVVADDADALWLADSNGQSQAAITAGAKTLNSVATYPALSTWKQLDPEGRYADVYNRYAHIDIAPSSEETGFELVSTDRFKVNLDTHDLQKPWPSYWLTRRNLEEWNDEEVAFVKISETGNGMRAYMIEYADGD